MRPHAVRRRLSPETHEKLLFKAIEFRLEAATIVSNTIRELF
jgi:hypothetical protein